MYEWVHEKRVALASPAKFGTKKLAVPKILPSEVCKQEVVQTIEEMDFSMEEYKIMQKVKMAPLERVVHEEEHYAGIAQAKIARESTDQIGH